MSTESLVNRLRSYAPGWSSVRILELMQLYQDELFSYDSDGLRFVPSDNKGFPPYLKTVDGTYVYSINSTNLASSLNVTIGSGTYAVIPNKIIKVFIDASDTQYGEIVLGRPYQYRFGYPMSPDSERLEISDVPCRLDQGNAVTAPKVTFFNNPGTHNDLYFVEFTYLPPRLTSINIPLMVPREFERAIFEGVLGEIEFLENKKTNDMQTRFEQYWKTRFRDMMSAGVQGFSRETTPCDC